MKIMDPIKIIAMSVCFFVLCNRHWFNGPPPYSDAGCADPPQTLMGAPVNIGDVCSRLARVNRVWCDTHA